MDKGYLVVPSPDTTLKIDMEVYEKICCAIFMASNIGAENKLYMISSESVSKAYFRAALAEYVSIEDILKIEYPGLTQEYSIVKSSNPLFHLMKLLRDYNIHLGHTELTKEQISVVLEKHPSEVHQLDIQVVTNLNAGALKNLRNAKHYSDTDLLKMVEMFNNQQLAFGVGDLIIRGLLEYSRYVEKFLTKHSS